MKIEICNTKNPLIRDGTSQPQRRLSQLHPHYARIDEHSLSDLMNYAASYAKELQYYDGQNKAAGDWQDFFDRDIASIISIVANKDNRDYKKIFNQLKAQIDEAETEDALKNSGVFEILFNYIFQLSSEFNSWVLKILSDDGFKRHLYRLVSSQLKDILVRTIGAYRYAQDYVWFDDNAVMPEALGFDQEAVFAQPYSSLWDDTNSGTLFTLGDWINGADKDNTIFDYAGNVALIRFKKAAETLLSWAGSFLQSQNQLINDAPTYLCEAIHHWPNHKPHMALYIAFIRLFKFAQIHLNSLTGKHLDHYYQTILGFTPLPSTEDRVHVLFELAKQSKHHLLNEDTLLKAGFDQSGLPVQYKLNRELVVNKAKIKDIGDIKSVYIDRNEGQGYRIYSAPIANSKDGKGLEFSETEPKWKPFAEDQLNNGSLIDPENRTAELAEIGFAVSSALLDLREGKRTITLKIYTDAKPEESLSTDQIEVRLSGEKDWIDAEVLSFTYTSNYVLLKVELNSTQPPVFPFYDEVLNIQPFTPRNFYTRTGTQSSTSQSTPVMQVILLHDLENNQPFPYKNLKDLTVDSIDLKVEVEELKSLVVQSDLGTLDANKPFQAFGPRPVLGNTFYVGSDEAFRKPVTSMTLTGEWLDAPADFNQHYEHYFDFTELVKLNESFLKDVIDKSGRKDVTIDGLSKLESFDQISATFGTKLIFETPINEETLVADVSLLNKKAWEPQSTDPLFNVSDSQLEINFETSTDNSGKNIPYFDLNSEISELKQYKNDTQQGFIKLELSGPSDVFGHKLYSQVYAKKIVQLIKAPDTTILPNEPYTPVLNNLSLSYTAEVTLNLSEAADLAAGAFHHIYPFGTLNLSAASQSVSTPTNNQTVTSSLADSGTPTIPTVPATTLVPPAVNISQIKKTSLLPQFRTDVDEVSQENNGELYIGLTDATPPQMVTLFFQVAEGSANPELNKETIHWSVLQDNQWVTLNTKQISYNSTNELNQSGIISITLADTINNTASMLPDGKIWLKASVLKNTDAVSQLIEVATQVGEASFKNESNDDQFLASSLPGGSITKLTVKQSQIKKINQPYASVDGKAAESPSIFNTRVSERLRHKDRAITIWDYEKIVLQEFPDIFKVKCINHSTYLYERGENDFFTSEFAPGYVTVIVIPDLTNQNAINPLEPKTSLDKLDVIKSFLKKRMTPFAARKLRVVNPLYETIQLEFTVAFHPEFDPAMYLEILNQDIMEFLSPWAFFNTKHKEINFGGKVHRSILVNFAEERDYVDYITNFKMNQLTITKDEKGEEKETGQYDIEEATPTSARSIFVSHAQHLIKAGDNC
ncbi:hypothetical protein [Aliikangiella coralliicola]|uniref:Baseplate protein J-like domain-containing protein n=1 Tax=Aliikangiella coralliicola TaxID=2592383 RepID=A0A545UD93_9GAMM|nr:hypothetical protein [Aliikangiella coralliicola]TQV87431.1 hypothetical protein FLL46_13385 [Aliikangiella coralliicola]